MDKLDNTGKVILHRTGPLSSDRQKQAFKNSKTESKSFIFDTKLDFLVHAG